VRTVRRLIDEVERPAGKGLSVQRGPAGSVAKERQQESNPEATKPKARVTYQVSEQPSGKVQEEEFAKQLRIARYLAAGGSSRSLGAMPEAKASKRGRPVATAGVKTKAGTASKKAREEELAKERRRAGRVGGEKGPSFGPHRGDKQRRSMPKKTFKPPLEPL
jgi:hypothetical protein